VRSEEEPAGVGRLQGDDSSTQHVHTDAHAADESSMCLCMQTRSRTDATLIMIFNPASSGPHCSASARTGAALLPFSLSLFLFPVPQYVLAFSSSRVDYYILRIRRENGRSVDIVPLKSSRDSRRRRRRRRRRRIDSARLRTPHIACQRTPDRARAISLARSDSSTSFHRRIASRNSSLR